MEFDLKIKSENGGWSWYIQNAQGWADSLEECMKSAYEYIDKYKIRKPKLFGQFKRKATV